MTKKTRRKIDTVLKATIALAALLEQVSMTDLGLCYEAPPNQIVPRSVSSWMGRHLLIGCLRSIA